MGKVVADEDMGGDLKLSKSLSACSISQVISCNYIDAASHGFGSSWGHRVMRPRFA
jgi:hypothetical protein